MRITPLAAESLGTRSMATWVETEDCKILIDPGVNLGAYRYGLSPHPLERWQLAKHRDRIHLFSESSDTIVITHYHFDHFSPDDLTLYEGKTLLLKNPNQKINVNQRNRAFDFLKRIKGLTHEISYIDGRTFTFGETTITFSAPVPHGSNQKAGFVVPASVQCRDEKFLITSDIQGFFFDDTVDFIIAQNPNLLYFDGPVTYLQDISHMEDVLVKTIENGMSIMERTNVRVVVVDHHLLRDVHWKKRIEPLMSYAQQKGIVIQTAAEYRGEQNNPLEARRNILYESDPPSPSELF